MNGHDVKRPNPEAVAQARHDADRLALQIGTDIVAMIQKNHPHVHPGIVAQALAATMASMIVLFAKGDAEALGGAEAAYRTMRQSVIGMMAQKRKKDAAP
jgi:hypothetical protein